MSCRCAVCARNRRLLESNDRGATKAGSPEEIWFGDGFDKLYAAIEGDGPTLIFYHGGYARGADTIEMLRPLVRDFRLVAPDVRGFGKSSCTSVDRYTWQQYADDVARLMDELELESAVIGGASLGSMITIATALRSHNRVRACVLQNPAAMGNRSGWLPRQINSQAFRAKLKIGREIEPSNLPKAIESLIQSLGGTPSPEAHRYHCMESIAAFWSTIGPPWGIQPFDDLAELECIDVPTLIIPGNDDVHPPEVAEVYHAKIPNSTILNPSLHTEGGTTFDAQGEPSAASEISVFLKALPSALG